MNGGEDLLITANTLWHTIQLWWQPHRVNSPCDLPLRNSRYFSFPPLPVCGFPPSRRTMITIWQLWQYFCETLMQNKRNCLYHAAFRCCSWRKASRSDPMTIRWVSLTETLFSRRTIDFASLPVQRDPTIGKVCNNISTGCSSHMFLLLRLS